MARWPKHNFYNISKWYRIYLHFHFACKPASVELSIRSLSYEFVTLNVVHCYLAAEYFSPPTTSLRKLPHPSIPTTIHPYNYTSSSTAIHVNHKPWTLNHKSQITNRTQQQTFSNRFSIALNSSISSTTPTYIHPNPPTPIPQPSSATTNHWKKKERKEIYAMPSSQPSFHTLLAWLITHRT